LGKNL